MPSKIFGSPRWHIIFIISFGRKKKVTTVRLRMVPLGTSSLAGDEEESITGGKTARITDA
jgi:hypothetical protein